MYKIVLNTCRLSAILVLTGCLQTFNASAQISLTGQLWDRAEDRNGYSILVHNDARPAGFICQRTRLIFYYKWDLLTVDATIQDVRVFGAYASRKSTTGNHVFLH